MSLVPPGPLSYLGTTALRYILKHVPPTSSDVKNFPIPTLWVDITGKDAYVLVNNEVGVATWVQIGGEPGGIDTITTPDATIVIPVDHNVNFLNGTGMSITGSGDDVTFNATGTGLTWSVIETATHDIEVNNGYFADRGAGVTFTLPVTAAVGDAIIITTLDAGGFVIAQNADQNIRLGNQVSTTGVGGSIASSAIGDSVTMVCSVENTSFQIISTIGNLTVT